MRYVPYHDLVDTPNIIVDGAGNANTLLTLSHWPHSGTPWELKDDLSAQIVFKYLDHPECHVSAEAASNNHFDEDGLVSLFALLNPEVSPAMRELLIDVAAAGDFGTYRFRDAARIAFVIGTFADAGTSPLDRAIFHRPYPETTAILYREMLARLPEILDHLERFQELWEPRERELDQSEAAIRNGSIRIEEVPSLDLAVITLDDTQFACHPMAVHNATPCSRILQMTGRRYELRYRYESWVQVVSRRVLPRVDLTPLASQLSEEEGKRWVFDGVDAITPHLALMNSRESRIPPEVFRRDVETFLASASPAWDPFDPQ